MFFNPSRLKVACCSIVSLLLDFEDTMSKNITAVELLMTFVLLLLITVIDETDGGKGLKLFAKDQPKIRHMQRKVSVRGKYKYKEEVIKKIEHDHPCKLTQTAVKITFPGSYFLNVFKDKT